MTAANFGLSDLAKGLQSMGALFNGGLGGYRGRLASYLAAKQPIREKGELEPNGLLNGIADVIGYGANMAWDAGGYAACKARDAFATYADAWGAFKAGQAG